jgi:hypothetical protein
MNYEEMESRPVGRPADSPDLLALIETVATRRDKDRLYQEIAGARVDLQAAAYVGNQRAMRALGIDDTAGVMVNLLELTQMTALYMEALALGVELERQRKGR